MHRFPWKASEGLRSHLELPVPRAKWWPATRRRAWPSSVSGGTFPTPSPTKSSSPRCSCYGWGVRGSDSFTEAVELRPCVLWGVRPLGNRKSGYRRPCLRIAPGCWDADAFVSGVWEGLACRECDPVPSLVGPGSGNVLALKDFHSAARVALVLVRRLGMGDPDLFTSGEARPH